MKPKQTPWRLDFWRDKPLIHSTLQYMEGFPLVLKPEISYISNISQPTGIKFKSSFSLIDDYCLESWIQTTTWIVLIGVSKHLPETFGTLNLSKGLGSLKKLCYQTLRIELLSEVLTHFTILVKSSSDYSAEWLWEKVTESLDQVKMHYTLLYEDQLSWIFSISWFKPVEVYSGLKFICVPINRMDSRC